MTRGTRNALVLTLGYVLLGTAYIIISGWVVAGMAGSREDLAQLERAKGVLYMVVTGVGVFALGRSLYVQIERSHQAVLQRERLLLANERRVLAGLLAASVAHDANNVLTTVLGELDELTDEPAGRAETMARLTEAVDRLIELNQRLVQVARDERVSEQRPLRLDEAVRGAVELLHSHPSVRTATLELDTAPATVVAHPALVSQIVTNLVVNGAEASDGRGRVKVTVRPAPPHALVRVDDSGPGVPLDKRAGLFEALTTTKPQGNGMGLFSVKACVQALGGTVEVGEAPGGGASFLVRLPLQA